MRKVLAFLILCSGFAFSQGGTTSSDLYPAVTGQNLGNPSQRWNLYGQNLDITGTFNCTGAGCPALEGCIGATTGALGTGTSGNPYTGWESVVSAAPDGSCVQFPAGYFATATGATINHNINLKGAGRDVTFITATSPMAYILRSDGVNARSYSISGLTLNANSNAATALFVLNNTFPSNPIENVEVENATGTGVIIQGCQLCAVSGIFTHDNGGRGIVFFGDNATVATGITAQRNQMPGIEVHQCEYLDWNTTKQSCQVMMETSVAVDNVTTTVPVNSAIYAAIGSKFFAQSSGSEHMQITAINVTPTYVNVGNAGTSGYTSGTNVSVTAPSGCSGMTVDVTASAGKITSAVVNAAGTGCTPGMKIYPVGGSGDGYLNIAQATWTLTVTRGVDGTTPTAQAAGTPLRGVISDGTVGLPFSGGMTLTMIDSETSAAVANFWNNTGTPTHVSFIWAENSFNYVDGVRTSGSNLGIDTGRVTGIATVNGANAAINVQANGSGMRASNFMWGNGGGSTYFNQKNVAASVTDGQFDITGTAGTSQNVSFLNPGSSGTPTISIAGCGIYVANSQFNWTCPISLAAGVSAAASAYGLSVDGATNHTGLFFGNVLAPHTITISASPTGLVRSGNTVTETTSVSHNYATGDYIYNTGAISVGATSFNGYFGPITVTGVTTFTFAQTAADDTGGLGSVLLASEVGLWSHSTPNLLVNRGVVYKPSGVNYGYNAAVRDSWLDDTNTGLAHPASGQEDQYAGGVKVSSRTSTASTFYLPVVLPIATGTAPLTVTSTTPVANLSATPTTYNAAGTQQANAHIVADKCTLGTSCSVTLAGSAVFTGATTYQCSATDETAAAAVKFAPSSGSAFALTGTGTDVLSYVCVGN